MGRQDWESETLIPTGGCFDDAYSIRTANTSSNGWGIQREVTHTLDQAQGLAIAFPWQVGGTQGMNVETGGVCGTLVKNQTQAVAIGGYEGEAKAYGFYGGNKRADRPEGGFYVKAEETSKTLDAASGLNPTCAQGGTGVMQAMAVRRLTPVECERLQGFPDNYTDIRANGKPTPDGPRYKALGNSMAVPVMRWIGERIAQVEAITNEKDIAA